MRMSRCILRFVTLFVMMSSLLLMALTPAGAQQGQHVDVVQLDGVVDPIMAQYIGRSIDRAVDDGAVAVIIEMDTPGGLDSSMRKIIAKMLASPVPIVVYVSPPGARAASAGVFITMASHVASMAPATNIGSAHPVGGQGEDIEGNLGEKVVNDAVAYIRNLAEKRGRNADWAEEAVRKSVNITGDEAVEKHVVEFIATDIRDLLNRLDSRQVTTSTGTTTLKTAGAAINRLEMNIQERFLHTLVNPTLAYLLLTIGIWALIAEFNNPGAILPGVTGAICLILAFIAFESLPLNWGGVALILLSVVLFIADIKAPSHGVLTVGGAITFILGSLVLFSPLTPTMPSMPADVRVPWPWIAVMGGLSVLVFTVAIGAGIRAQKVRVTAGIESMIGATGVATSDLNPWGTVLVKAEDWSAIAEGGPIRKGEMVRVVGTEGIKLRVVAVSSPR